MRQRVGLARALVVHPDLLLMDEPFSALDVLTAENLRTDLIDLWSEGKLPVNSVLMVTHNIEEAVLMCDRILVFSSNPGRVANELRVPFPHPRNRLDPAFRQMVDDIYGLMTRRPVPSVRAVAAPPADIAMPLQRVGTNQMAGLMEALAGPPYNGRADLPALAAALQYEVDELLPLGETLQLLHFAVLEEGDIHLTEEGRRFVDADTEERKQPVRRRAARVCAAGSHGPPGAGRALEPSRLRGAFPRRARGPHVARLRRGHAAHPRRLGPLRRTVQLRRGGGTVQPGGHRLIDIKRPPRLRHKRRGGSADDLPGALRASHRCVISSRPAREPHKARRQRLT